MLKQKASPAELKAILKELDKRAGILPKEEVTVNANLRQKERSHKFMQALHPKQMEFALDPARRKVALCTRRAGKTTVASFMMVRAALEYDHCLIPYVTTTRDNAKQLMWEELKAMDRKWNFGMSFNETSLVATMPNGSRMWLMGAKHRDDIEKLRGPKYPFAVLDEAASFGPHIEELILSIVGPALRDYLGTMILIGTPGMLPAGLFYDATTGKRKNWSVHKWSLMDNPYLPAEARDLALIREEEGLSEEDPKYRREYLGEWVIDDHNLVYKFSYDRNTYKTPLQLDDSLEWHYNLGVDLGFNDDTAFVVGAYSYGARGFYVIETYKEPKMDITRVAEKIKEFEAKYPFSSKVIDSGALGKMITEELIVRHGLSMKPAEKKDKLGHIEQFNSDLLMGRILVPDVAKDLHDEWQALPWHEARREEHPGYANHLADACLYAWRDARHYVGQVVEKDKRTPAQIREDEYEQRLAGKGPGGARDWWDI